MQRRVMMMVMMTATAATAAASAALAGATLAMRVMGTRAAVVRAAAVMLMGLAGEVSVLRDRLDTVERLAQEHNLFSQADIEAYQPSEQVLVDRARNREILLGEVTRIISSEVEELQSSTS